MKSEKGQAGLLIVIIAFIGIGLIAGAMHLSQQSKRVIIYSDRPLPSDYVPANGDCFVPPKGDPLYDEHYAKEVNQYNCEAFVNQSQANHIDAETERIEVGTSITKLGINGFLLVIGSIVGLLIVLIVKR